MNDFSSMSGVNSGADLRDDYRCLFGWKRSMLAGVLLEQLAGGPLDRKKVETSLRLSDLDCAHDVRVQHSRAVLRFAHKTGDGRTIMPEFFAKNLESYGTMARMLSPVYRRCTALADLTLNGVPGYLGADQGLMRHAGEGNRNRFLWIG